MKTGIAMNEDVVDLNTLWASGYTVSELWGRTEPVSRGGPAATNSYLIMWGILSIVDDQVSHGAGHRICVSGFGMATGLLLAIWTSG
ncbi:hypothetical protein V1281_000277 [Nitrobacteraceae bacterium AZCC 2161]